jgi:diacylglycerol O-acyltransferase / wax synthase
MLITRVGWRTLPGRARPLPAANRVDAVARLDRLTDADAGILRLESGTIRGHTCKLTVVGPPRDGGALSLPRLRTHIGDRVGRFPRLRRRLLEGPLGIANPAWVDDPDFHVDRHVFAFGAGGPVDPPGLRAIVAELMAQRLDRDRPLWRVDLIELDDGGAALVMRIHHCLADGMTAGRILNEVVLDSDAPAASATDGAGFPAPGTAGMLALAVRDQVRRTATALARGARTAGSPAAWSGMARTVRGLPGAVRRELLEHGTDSPLDAPAGPRRVVAFATRPLEDVRRISKVFGQGVTINDVVLTAVAGGLRAWLEGAGAAVGELRAKVPVSLHHAGEDAAASANRDSFMVVDLGLERSDPVGRLLAVSAETQDRKRHHDAEEIDALLRDLGHVSRSLERLAERWAMRPRVFAVNVSNVPGPRGDLTLLGVPVREVHSLAEVANRHALRVSAFSAGGVMSFGLCADAAVMEDIDTVASGVEADLAELLARVPVV